MVTHFLREILRVLGTSKNIVEEENSVSNKIGKDKEELIDRVCVSPKHERPIRFREKGLWKRGSSVRWREREKREREKERDLNCLEK
jgi:hypothetical protein